MRIIRFLLLLTILLPLTCSYANEKDTYNCGVATGFPPYQFVDTNGKPAGLDIEVAEMVFKAAGLKVQFVQDKWENILFNLIHNHKEIDMICGIEITPERMKRLDFSTTYFKRRTVMFVLKDGPVKKLDDLYGKIVAGDLHSSFEKKLGPKVDKIRITKTGSKEESFQKLKDKSVMAVIAPLEVGLYLSKKLNIQVHVFDENDPGTAVSIAVKKGHDKILSALNTSLKKLIENGEIGRILKKHQLKERPIVIPQTQNNSDQTLKSLAWF